jgi:hypothetical protein
VQIILSRKGFDAQYGGQASPILPDGTLLSLPIPAKDEKIKYSDLIYKRKTYQEIIKELNPNSKIKDTYTCHLDPDLRKEIFQRDNDWLPLFGQTGSAQGLLSNNGIKKNDLFLFFGTFRETEFVKGNLNYKKSPELHLIYGYLQIGETYNDITNLPKNIQCHPHAQKRFENVKNNCIYQATDKLSFLPTVSGGGCFKFHEDLVLTQKGYSKSRWDLPSFFKNIKIVYHSPESFKDNYFQSASKGQEFIIEENDNVTGWAKQLIIKGTKA